MREVRAKGSTSSKDKRLAHVCRRQAVAPPSIKPLWGVRGEETRRMALRDFRELVIDAATSCSACVALGPSTGAGAGLSTAKSGTTSALDV